MCQTAVQSGDVVRTRRFGQEFIFKQIHLTGFSDGADWVDPAETDAGDAVCPAEAEMDSLEGADVAGSGRSDSVLIETFSTLPVVSVLPNTSSSRPVPDTATFDPLPFSASYPGISSETDIISACDAPRRFRLKRFRMFLTDTNRF